MFNLKSLFHQKCTPCEEIYSAVNVELLHYLLIGMIILIVNIMKIHLSSIIQIKENMFLSALCITRCRLHHITCTKTVHMSQIEVCNVFGNLNNISYIQKEVA